MKALYCLKISVFQQFLSCREKIVGIIVFSKQKTERPKKVFYKSFEKKIRNNSFLEMFGHIV